MKILMNGKKMIVIMNVMKINKYISNILIIII